MQHESPSLTEHLFPFENFLTTSSIIFYQCSLEDDFPIVSISPNVSDLLGYCPIDFYEDPTFWIDHIHQEDKDRIIDSFQNILQEKNRTYVYRLKKQDGSYCWLRDENTVIYNENGAPKTIAGTAFDITRQKEAENEIKKLNATLEQRIEQRTRNLTIANRKLKKQIQYRNKAEAKLSTQQQKLRLLQAGINHINDMVIISKALIDSPQQSEIVFVNKAFERFTGYQFAEVSGKNPRFLHGPKSQTKALDKLQRHINKNQPVRVEFINYKKDGSTYWVDLEMSPFPADEKGMQYWVGINRDITQRKKAEIALEISEKKYRAYTELSFDAIFEIALDGTIIECNARACSLFGYTRDELLGMNTKQLTPEAYRSSLPDKITPDITTGSNVLQRVYQRKDGTTFTTEINTKLYHHDEKNHLIAYVRDISDQIEYQNQIKQSLKEKNTLLAEVHHRVKNNLAVISGLLEMQAFNAENKQIIDELRESQSRIQSIATVHETLYQSESFSDIALHSYIDELVGYISDTYSRAAVSINIEKKIDPVSLTVKQAVPCGLLLNELITNAYKHAFPGLARGTITICLSQDGDRIVLSIADDGVGLPDNFDIASSSSLGMTLISTLVQQLNGNLKIETGSKTLFTVSFKKE